jgi:hypothetical protein
LLSLTSLQNTMIVTYMLSLSAVTARIHQRQPSHVVAISAQLRFLIRVATGQ